MADKAAGLDISSVRMDEDTDDITSAGFGNVITRDGQGVPTANLPMAGFRHTVVQNAVSRSDYAAFGQVQDGLPNWTIAGGSADAITATYTPALAVLSDGQLCFFRATAANATTTPTFAPNGLTARTITKQGGSAVAIGDIAGNLAESILRYNAANTRWELLNPSNLAAAASLATTGDIKLTIKTTADTGWLLFDDGTFGSASSGSSNSNSAANQALFTLLYGSPFTDTTAPLFTSSGAGTTRAAQGTAAAAWAANCRMSLPKTLGRALALAGSGSGLSARTLGQTTGTETQSLITANLPAYTPAGTVPLSVTSTVANVVQGAPAGAAQFTSGTNPFMPLSNTTTSGTLTSTGTGTLTGTPQGGTSTAFGIVQPTSFLNAMVKQ